MSEFNLAGLFTQELFPPPPGEPIEVEENQLVRNVSPAKYYRKDPYDPYGRDVFLPVEFKWGPDEADGVLLPYVWIGISAVKNIVVTPLTDRRGSVKELINIDDYRIRLRGYLIDRAGRFPEDQLKQLIDLFERNEAVELRCALTDMFLLTNENDAQDRVIIQDLIIPDQQGKEHVRRFEMSLITDQDLELTIE